MSLAYFYVSPPLLETDLLQLDDEEALHAIKVLRMKTGAVIGLTDGEGQLAKGEISLLGRQSVQVQVIERQLFPRRPYHLHLAIAPTKHLDRFEWFLEKATELGVDEITPVLCEHSERMSVKVERSGNILISAMKQSQQAWLPRLNPMTRLTELMDKAMPGKKYIAWCGTYSDQYLPEVHRTGSDALVLIGPEGDFSLQEIEYSKQSGFIPINLGPHRLRTETAGLAACVYINMINNL